MTADEAKQIVRAKYPRARVTEPGLMSYRIMSAKETFLYSELFGTPDEAWINAAEKIVAANGDAGKE